MNPFFKKKSSDDMLSKRSFRKKHLKAKKKKWRYSDLYADSWAEGIYRRRQFWTSLVKTLQRIKTSFLFRLLPLLLLLPATMRGRFSRSGRRVCEGGAGVVPWFIAKLNLASVPLSTLSRWRRLQMNFESCKWTICRDAMRDLCSYHRP